VEKKGTPAFSTVVYREGSARGKRGVAAVTALVLDFDHLTSEAAEEVARRLADRGWAYLAYTSFSHRASGDDDCCFRVLICISRPVAPKEHQAVWHITNNALGRLADANARDISRLWYIASCPPERAELAWVKWADGRALDVDSAIAAYKQHRSRVRRRGRKGPRKKGDSTGPIKSGSRNAQLTSLAGAMRRKGAERDAIEACLQRTNEARCQPPLEASEIARIAESVSNYDPTSPMLAAHKTDLGNAERFESFAGERFRFVHPWGSWIFFEGRRWQRDIDGEVVRWARDTLRAITAEASSVPDEGERDGLVKHAMDSESSSRVTAMLTLAQSLLPVATETLDRDLDLINCRNGTIDLRTGELREHDRADFITRMMPVEYDPTAECPLWDAFLLRAMDGNERLITFIQRAVGYSMTGHTSEQVLLLLYGIGANGKSTFIETVRALLDDYATIADFTTFLKRDNEGARNDLARLVGTRFVSAVETEAGKPLAEALVKQLTGGDTITARFLFKEFFDYRPQFKIWLAANHKPNIRGSDHGIWRRIRLVPFTVTIPEPERDPKLTAKLADELPGILAWAVRGCVDWRAEGLGYPEEVRAATESYREEMDILGPFLDECCFIHPEVQTTSKELNTAYAAWCEANGERPRTAKAVAGNLRV